MVVRSEKAKTASPKTDAKAVRDSVTPIVQESNGLPLNDLGEDLVRQTLVLGGADHTTGPVELGVYVPEEDRSSETYRQREDGMPLGGRSATIAFDDTYYQFFQRLTPQLRGILLYLAKLFSGDNGGKRMSALVEFLDERVEQQASARRWKRWRHSMLWLFGAAILFARYFVDQASWVVEKLPFFKEVWQLVIGWRA
jgi:hypothetical protein